VFVLLVLNARRGEEEREKRTIVGHGLAEGLADAHDYRGEDVLIARDEEESCVLRVDDVGLLWVENRRYEPRNRV